MNLWPFRRLPWAMIIALLLLTACDNPFSPAAIPLPAPAATDPGGTISPAPLLVEADRNLIVRAAPSLHAAPVGHLLTGQSAQTVALTDDKDWWQLDCGTRAPCWVPRRASLNHAYDTEQAHAATAQGQAPDAPTPTRLTPAGDATALVVHDAVTLTNMDHYVIYGQSGQELSVSLTGAGDSLYFAVAGIRDGQIYHQLDDPNGEWVGLLAAGQDYLISVATADVGAAYTLQIGLRFPTVAAFRPPVRLNFSPDRTSGRVDGVLTPGVQHRYILTADAAALLAVDFTAPDRNATFAVMGVADGQTYKWLYDTNAAWSAQLPAAQEYLIVVSGTDAAAAAYAMTVSVQ